MAFLVCPSCGRSVKASDWSTGTPNPICNCNFPKFVTQMVYIPDMSVVNTSRSIMGYLGESSEESSYATENKR